MAELNQAADHDSLLSQGSKQSCQLLCFHIAQQDYGVDILTIQEIRGWQTATQVPELPSYMRGVLNLRGNLVPMLDLRERLGLTPAELGPVTVVIIVQVQIEGQSKPIGLIVDAVSKVLTVTKCTIKPPPDLGDQRTPDYIQGLVEDGDHMVLLLEPNALLSEEDAASIGAAATE